MSYRLATIVLSSLLSLVSVIPAESQVEGSSYCRSIANGLQHGDTLALACQWVQSLPAKLPNVICDESIRRTEAILWGVPKDLGTVTATVTRDKTGEQYSDIKVNGKPTSSRVSDLVGAWSIGEFAGELSSVFPPQPAARFKFEKELSLQSTRDFLFTFQVGRKSNRTWFLVSPEGTIYPGFTGKLWISSSDGQVLRLEMETLDIPENFAIRRVMKKIEYRNVQLGDGSYFVLPSDLEITIDSDPLKHHSVNYIKFRNCHVWAAKSRILPEEGH